MTPTALLLVLAAAFAHAGWNLLSKQAAQAGGAAFVWLVAALSCVVLLPIVAVVVAVTRPVVAWEMIAMGAGTAVLHTVYFLLLQRAYRHGDLSLIYPLARGTGPLVAAALGIALLGERVGVSGYIGIGLICAGVFGVSLAGSRGPARPTPPAVLFGLATGVSIAAYTLWDKWAVWGVALSPVVYLWIGEVGRMLLLSPVAIRQRAEIRVLWARHRLQVIGTALLSPAAYLLVLFAMRFTPVSMVAPAREVSVLIGVIIGGRLLAEGHLRARLPAAAAIVVGLAAIALA